MARKVTTQPKVIVTAIAWTLGILIFFPILWTFLTSFKSEADAIASPPQFLFFPPAECSRGTMAIFIPVEEIEC